MRGRKKDKVMVVMVNERTGEELGRFRAYLAWSDGRKGRLFDGREVERINDIWVYIVR
jgi:hypothetical protein